MDTGMRSAQMIAAEASEAGKSNDWHRAASLWAEFCTLNPPHMGGPLSLMAALSAAGRFDEAEAAAKAAMERFPTGFEVHAAWARMSDARRDWRSSLVRWTDVFARFHDQPVAFLGVLSALRELRRFDEAEAFFQQNQSRFGANLAVACAQARFAMSAKNWPLAEARWAEVREAWPESREAYIGGASAQRELGRIDEAEFLLRSAIEKFGQSPDLLINFATLAESRKDFEAAFSRWSDAALVMPQSPAASLGQARMHARLGRNAEADSLLADLAARFPTSASVVQLQAIRANERQDWPVALGLWERAAALDPAKPFFFARVAEVLGRLNRHSEGEAVIAQALQKHPGNIDLLYASASLAHARCEWPAAKQRWQNVLDIDPSHDAAIFQLGIANYQLAGATTDPSSEIATDQKDKRFSTERTAQRNARELSTLEILMQMESIGDNCEFGLVQRKFGAEPLGLLRWTAMGLDKLADALDDDLQGVGAPENTSLELRGDEYHTNDTRYFMRMHTFIHANQVEDPNQLLMTLCKRLQYLRRELLGNLSEGHQSLYVYKSVLGYKPGAIERLCRSLQRLGPNTLLCVKLADAHHPEGTAERIDDTLIMGYISHFAQDGGWQKSAFGSWEKLSRQAFDIWQNIVAGR